MTDNIKVILNIIAKNPPMGLIGGGIILLILSPADPKFWFGGWILIMLGFVLQIVWLFLKYGGNQISYRRY
ncbi:MAG TPA: hypothetical protein VIO11_02710 [Candidatus Methanoperedens sp.]